MKLFYYVLAVTLSASQFTACKSKNAENQTQTTTTTDNTSTAPVEISTDDELTKGVKDATKDFPTVNATVNDGEVTLTGTIERDRLPTLMQSIQGLHPKKVNNNLTVQ